MKIVSPLLKNVVYPSVSKTGLFRLAAPEGLAIVTYHGVLPGGYASIDPGLDGNLITADKLRDQLRFLKKHYEVVAPDDVLASCKQEHRLPPKAVLLTCDDGLLNCLTDMLRVLQEENVRCLFFVTGASTDTGRAMLWYEDLLLLFMRAPAQPLHIVSGAITLQGELRSPEERRALWWSTVKRLSQLTAAQRASFIASARSALKQNLELDLQDAASASCRRFGLMNVAELRDLASAGMTIGAHTLSHPMLSQAPPEIAFTEIAESRTRLEAVLGTRIWAFAYPFGDSQSVTPEILEMPSKAGFRAAFLNVGGGLGTPLPDFALPRVHVTSDMKLGEFEAHVSGFYARLQRGRQHIQNAELASA
jgi:peptidoglycan/xylan/chitin deacetylase (PgdA/CDA1 family)